ncbi:MAG: transcription termination factor NusA [Calditrichaeota bacterium]|nr:transcription termination factor NusA [Calditrichota bacterium]HQU71259.1 transcription termination factor NusA [Calditrichia bacterium]
MKSQIVAAATEIAREKRIDKEDLRDILEDIFMTLMRRKYGEEAEFDVIVNIDRGDMEIYVEKEVVEAVEDPDSQISLEVARKEDPEVEEGELFAEVINPEAFGRRLINIAKQTLLQRLREYEKEKVYQEYRTRVGEIIIGDVHQETRGGYFVVVDRTEMFMPRSESIPNERLRRGDSVRALIKEVIKPDVALNPEEIENAPRRRRGQRPEIIISRADERFLIRLFEIEVPEIFDGIVEIKKVARKPGERSKIAVESIDKRIDPVGACVGMRGVRIQSVVRELNGEKIDVIAHTSEPELFVTRALTPAKPIRVIVNREEGLAVAIIPDKDMGLAMGRGESNRELAQELTGINIELIKESEYYENTAESEDGGNNLEMAVEDIPGLSAAVADKLIEAGITTAEGLRELGLQGLLEIPGIGEKTAQKILSQLNI